MRFHEVITQTKTVPPPGLPEEQQAQWVENTDKYGFPMYKYPFWFWDADGEFTPPGARRQSISCHPFLFPSSEDLYACSLWNGVAADKMSWSVATPIYMNDPNAYGAALQEGGFEIIKNPDEEGEDPTSHPVRMEDPFHEADAAAVAVHREIAQEKRASMGLLYLFVGTVGAAILYKAYGKKNN